MRSATVLVMLIVGFLSLLRAQDKGTVYVVYGSDTAIWAGMDVANRNPTYDLALYTSPSGNAARIMSAEFRSQITDSYGRPLVMTWWMMSGNIFRDATNTNVPIPNLMTMYLMKKYYGDVLSAWGDELSLHYHTFIWSDYNHDGQWYWNQARTFTECRSDFDFTIAQLLLEENVFPVSFRSGWHYMDNGWQQRLNELLPFSMHNDYPNKRVQTTEPIDNVFDWSQAPSSWIPYHPSPDNYQIPGTGKGWNLRSRSLGGTSRATLEPAFQEASSGKDQILCLWSHLPDNSIFDNLLRVNGLLHSLAVDYPGVLFKYVTAVKGMQQFLRSADTTKPDLQVSLEGTAGSTTVRVASNKQLTGGRPFVALKTKSEDFQTLSLDSVGTMEWTSSAFDANEAARIGVSGIDSVGNLATWFHSFAPEDQFLDDESSAYKETRGTWTTIASATWGVGSRVATVPAGDSATAVWTTFIPQDGIYSALIQLPPVPSRCEELRIRIRIDGNPRMDSLMTIAPANRWIDLGNSVCSAGSSLSVELTGVASPATAQNLGADVVRITPLIPSYRITPGVSEISLGFRSLHDSIFFSVPLRNTGLRTATISTVGGSPSSIQITDVLPKVVEAGQTASLRCLIVPGKVGPSEDTVAITFSESELPAVRIPVRALIERIVRVIDNDDPQGYAESGAWQQSNVTAFGQTSRYCFLSPPGQYAEYTTTLPEDGFYSISFLVPGSENATDKALYRVSEGTRVIDSVFISQQPGGIWTPVGMYRLSSDSLIKVRVINAGGYTSGAVLRADAMKFSAADITVVNQYILDNDSSGVYQESGVWHTSNAQAFGPSSRYANLAEGPGQKATFRFQVWDGGTYALSTIVPSTLNATDNALYRIWINGELADSVRKNQCLGSGSWVPLGVYPIPSNRPVLVEIINDGLWKSGTVLRADAIRASRLTTAVTEGAQAVPVKLLLDHAYPNPFNSSTNIRLQIPEEDEVSVLILDLLGRTVRSLLTSRLKAGSHTVYWDGLTSQRAPASSGIYFVRVQSGNRVSVQKVVLLK